MSDGMRAEFLSRMQLDGLPEDCIANAMATFDFYNGLVWPENALDIIRKRRGYIRSSEVPDRPLPTSGKPMSAYFCDPKEAGG